MLESDLLVAALDESTHEAKNAVKRIIDVQSRHPIITNFLLRNWDGLARAATPPCPPEVWWDLGLGQYNFEWSVIGALNFIVLMVEHEIHDDGDPHIIVVINGFCEPSNHNVIKIVPLFGNDCRPYISTCRPNNIEMPATLLTEELLMQVVSYHQPKSPFKIGSILREWGETSTILRKADQS